MLCILNSSNIVHLRTVDDSIVNLRQISVPFRHYLTGHLTAEGAREGARLGFRYTVRDEVEHRKGMRGFLLRRGSRIPDEPLQNEEKA